MTFTLPATTIPGIVWAYRLKPDERLCERLPADASRTQIDPEPSGFVWLHLNLADQRVPGFLESLGHLSPDVVAALTTHETHASITLDEQKIYGTLVDFQREFDSETRDIGWLHFAVVKGMIITTRLQPLRSIDRVRTSLEKNPARCRQPIDIFEMIVVEFQRTLISLVMELTEELNQIEDIVYDSAARDERRRLAPVRRTVVRLHRHLRTILTLMRRAAASDEDDMPLGFDDTASRLMARLESVDYDVYALQERARLLHEEIDSKLSSETNRHLYILSLMTAFLLPPSLITGFFGMNTSDLPFAHGTGGTTLAFGFIVLSVVCAWWVLRRARIL